MADAVIGMLVENLNSLIQREFGLIWGIEEDISNLASLLTTVQAVLRDAEMREFAEKSIANWLKKLKDTAYDADDVLDEWLTYTTDSTCAFSCLSLNHMYLRHCIAQKAKKIITRLDEIAGERSKLHLNSGVVQTGLQSYESRETGSTLTEDVVYGRDVDKEKIINVLLNNVNHGESLPVLSIVGIGGLGKTTLAQFIYKDERVVEHFDIKIWICVSEDFEVKRLIKMMLESLTDKTCDLKDMDPLQRRLKENLSGKRFLLVLDDVWNEDLEKWHIMKSLLTCGAKGSSILVTTRLEAVASIVGTMLTHRLTFLSEEDCWYLFKRRAFGVGTEENADLVEIGKQIVKKCGGVPLPAKSLGGMLFSTREVADWMQVKDSDIWELPQAEVNGILPSLRLSYKCLPSIIKQCFAFCAICPKDYEMKKEELVHLWIANGFVKSHGRMELEDVGNQVFIELLRRSFFQDIETNESGDIQTCKMHDLACSVSVNECCVVEVRKVDKFHEGIRHGSLLVDSFVAADFVFTEAKQSNLVLRTLLLLGPSRNICEFDHINLKTNYCLRALDLSGSQTKSIPTSAGRMIHLRYLNLSSTDITSLPENICNLRNLQSLKLRNCSKLKKLPKHMRKMNSLRHLDIMGCWKLTEMPISMGELTRLQTLNLFVVGIKKGRDISELRRLNHLRGEVRIERLEHVRNVEVAKEANLSTKQKIFSLTLSWSDEEESGVGIASSYELQEKVLVEGLQPHRNLKKLVINGYKGAILPSWIEQLQHLAKITLKFCNSCECLPPLRKLPLLKFLSIGHMDSVKCIGDNFYGEGVGGGGSAANAIQGCSNWFPSLRQLHIDGMGALEEWSLPSSSSTSVKEKDENYHHHPRAGVQVAFPCLQQLAIKRCPKLKAIPFLSCVQNIALWDCNEMILKSLVNLPPHSLLTLVIWEFKKMIHLPEGTFINSSAATAALQSLEIRGCHKLKRLSGEIQNLTALTTLKISNCNELDSLLELEGLLHKLTSLTHLSIQNCESLKCLPVMGIQGDFNNSLKELDINDSENLTSVSEGLQYLSSLQKLSLEDCPELEFISRDDQEDEFQYLISLQSLVLYNMPKLSALPEGMQQLTMLQSLKISWCKNLRMLPEWLQHLTSLQSLEISYCHPDLHKRCEDNGEDWHIIAHIPQLKLC